MKSSTPTVDVTSAMRVKATDLGGVIRLDLNQIGARVADAMLQDILKQDLGQPVLETVSERRSQWAGMQNRGIIETMNQQAGRWHGDVRSFAEWTALGGALYDSPDMRRQRLVAFGNDYRAAATTLDWTEPASGWGVRLQATGFIPKSNSEHFRQYAWQPESIYKTEFMALAPVVVTELADVKLLHLSGVVGWNRNIEPQFVEQPAKQIAMVFDLIQAVVEEAGGSLADIMRVRPFCHGLSNATLVQQAICERWRHVAPPAQLLCADVNFGDPAKLFTEISAMAIVAKPATTLHHDRLDAGHGDDPTRVVRLTCSDRLHWVQAGELKPMQAADAETEAAQIVCQIQQIMDVADLNLEDLALLFVYAGHSDHARAITEAVDAVLPPGILHVVPCPAMRDMQGCQLKAELTACRGR